MSCVLGIDVSSFAIDLVKLDETTNHGEWARIELGTDKIPAFERLRNARAASMIDFDGFLDDVYLSAIEVPKTRFMQSAATLFPVYGAVVAMIPRTLELWDVHPTHWRKALDLKGNAKKDECAARVRDIMLRTYQNDPIDWPQDAFDAYAVAYYARELNARGIALDAAREQQLVLV